MFHHFIFAKSFLKRFVTAKKAMSLQAIFDIAFSQRVVTPQMEASLSSLLWSHKFSKEEMQSLAIMTRMLESGEIAQLRA